MSESTAISSTPWEADELFAGRRDHHFRHLPRRNRIVSFCAAFSRSRFQTLGSGALVDAFRRCHRCHYFRLGQLCLLVQSRPTQCSFAETTVCTEIRDDSGAVTEYLCPLSRTLSGKKVRGLRIWVPLSEISKELQDLVIFLEDAKFYQHTGLDLAEIKNAIEEDVENRRFSRGASTITQQLAKNIFLSKEKSIVRKATEVPLAFRLENELTKKEILELYLNTIEWGPDIFGVEAAARTYFGRSANQINTQEAILLALLIPNPVDLNPWVRPKAIESIEKRAQQLKKRLIQEQKYTKLEAQTIFEQFDYFLREWSVRPRPIPPLISPTKGSRKI